MEGMEGHASRLDKSRQDRTRQDRASTLVEAVLEFNRERAQGPWIWPCLIGPTGTGKTSRARSLAEAKGLRCRTLLLHSMQEDEVLGLPRVPRGRELVTRWTLPEWAAGQGPALVLLDELDKPRPEVRSLVLTLLAEKRIRDHILEGSAFIGCMQPVESDLWLADETGKALSARLVFIRVGQEESWLHLAGKTGVDLSFLPVEPKCQAPILPAPSPRQVEWAIGFVRSGLLEGEALQELLEGMMPAHIAEALIEACRHDVAGSLSIQEIEGLIRRRGASFIRSLSVPEVIQIADSIWAVGDLECMKESFRKVWLTRSPEEIRAFHEALYDGLMNRAREAGGEVEIVPGASEDQVLEALEEVVAEVAREWQAALGQEGGAQ